MSDETPPAQTRVTSEEALRAVTVGALQPLAGKILIVEYDPDWPQQFALESRKIRAKLGERVLMLEHVGSTSVPCLAAKPIIDILLVVADSADEAAYVPLLEKAGYALRIREPEWYEHRVLKGVDPAVNLHIFSPDCEETERMLRMRNWLREHDSDRDLYERTKRALAECGWMYTQNYADAKSDVVERILAKARAAGTTGLP